MLHTSSFNNNDTVIMNSIHFFLVGKCCKEINISLIRSDIRHQEQGTNVPVDTFADIMT